MSVFSRKKAVSPITLEDLGLAPAGKPLRLLLSDVVDYRGYGHQEGGCFGLEVYDGPGSLVAIATEIPENQACSITNGSENVAVRIEGLLRLPHVFGGTRPPHSLARRLWGRLKRLLGEAQEKQYVLVEHYTPDSYEGRDAPEDFAIVHFMGSNPGAAPPQRYYAARDWAPVEKSEIERLIGAPLA